MFSPHLHKKPGGTGPARGHCPKTTPCSIGKAKDRAGMGGSGAAREKSRKGSGGDSRPAPQLRLCRPARPAKSYAPYGDKAWQSEARRLIGVSRARGRGISRGGAFVIREGEA